jgi:hypothetical protein
MELASSLRFGSLYFVLAPLLFAGPFPNDAIFSGMCDASAAAAIGEAHFIVANDEDNILRVYSRSGGAPIDEFDLSEFLEAHKKETDLEGAAPLGARVFWITSHGRTAKGDVSSERQRFFGTDITLAGRRIEVQPAGRPYTRLLEDLLREKRLAPYRLSEAAKLAPKAKGALNIEALSATPDGHLLIGFRNPIRDGKALLVPLLNPSDLIEGERASFGDPIDLDLGGLGVRSMGWDAGRYLIIAGAFGEGGRSRLYEWSGQPNDQPRLVKRVAFRGFNPEGIMFTQRGSKAEYFVLSDDGTRIIDGHSCKELNDPARRQFRGTVVKF